MKSPLSTSNSSHPLWRFGGHSVLFVLAILCAQTLIYLACGGEKTSLPEGVWNHLQHKAPILYFGDSVLTHTEAAREETTLPNLLQARMPNIPIGTVSHRAYHAGVYEAFGDYLVCQPYRPRLCIFEINMRSFSTGWEMRPEWQFQEEKLKLTHGILFRIFFRALAVFKTFNLSPVKQQDFDQAPVFDGERVTGQVRDYLGPDARPTLADMFVFNYMYRLREDHKKVQQLVTLCGLLKSHHIEPLFYVTPVDYETGERTLGPRFAKQIDENVGLVKGELTAAGGTFVDLSRSLAPEDFDWRVVSVPNEHLKLKGRKQVAEQLARVVRAHGFN